jgi:hypothetical protein
MYKKLDKPDKWFKTEHGRVMSPLVTLETAWGAKCQIALDDRCYVIYKDTDRGYKTSPYISWDILEVLKTLPPPR